MCWCWCWVRVVGVGLGLVECGGLRAPHAASLCSGVLGLVVACGGWVWWRLSCCWCGVRVECGGDDVGLGLGMYGEEDRCSE